MHYIFDSSFHFLELFLDLLVLDLSIAISISEVTITIWVIAIIIATCCRLNLCLINWLDLRVTMCMSAV